MRNVGPRKRIVQGRLSITEISKEATDAVRARAKNNSPCAIAAHGLSIRKIEVAFDNGVTLAVPTSLVRGLAGASAAVESIVKR